LAYRNWLLSGANVVGLAHGAARVNTSERKANREQQFIKELLTALPIHPVTARRFSTVHSKSSRERSVRKPFQHVSALSCRELECGLWTSVDLQISVYACPQCAPHTVRFQFGEHTISSLISPSELSLTVRFSCVQKSLHLQMNQMLNLLGQVKVSTRGLLLWAFQLYVPPPNNGFLPLPQETLDHFPLLLLTHTKIASALATSS